VTVRRPHITHRKGLARIEVLPAEQAVIIDPLPVYHHEFEGELARGERGCLVDSFQMWQDLPKMGYDYMVFLRGCGGDWVNCPQSIPCSFDKSDLTKWQTDPSFRAKFTHHLGGANVGFADGQAAWMSSEAILFGGDQAHGYGRQNAPLEGLEVCGVFYP
jgi:prepilin-type processing-associated H-X9-DG protein